MPVKESQKVARNKWDAANMTIIGCRARKSKAEQFKAIAHQNGTTPNALLLEFVDSYINKNTPGSI